MKIIIYEGKQIEHEFDVDDLYYDKITKGLDICLVDLYCKCQTLTEKDIPTFLLERYSPQEALSKYIDKQYGELIHMIHHLKNNITKEKLELKKSWIIDTAINSIFKKYCDFSLLKEPTFGEFAVNSVTDLFYRCGGLSEQYDNRIIKTSET